MNQKRFIVVRRIALVGFAAACFILAAFLFAKTGLPDRATFTGQMRLDGQRIAPEIGALAPQFTAITLQGHELALSQSQGTPVIINFWATWCAPCLLEMPELQRLYAEDSARGLHILAVNRAESSGLVQSWVERLGLTYDIVLDEDEHLARLYWLRDVPSTYVIAPDGVITHIFYGPVTAGQLRDVLQPYWS